MKYAFRSFATAVFLGAATLLFIATFSIVKAADPAKHVSIAYIVKYGTVPYFINEARGVRSKAQQLGADISVEDVEQDSNLELTNVNTAVGQGVSGIITVVPSQKLGPAVIARAQAANIPLIAVDDPIVDGNGKPAPFIGFDATAIGTQVGDELAQLFQQAKLTPGAEVKIASIEDQATPVCMQRNVGAWNAFRKHIPNFDVANVLHIPYHNDLHSAIDAMAPVATAHPEVKTWLVYSCNDAGMLGAWRALSNNGVTPDHVFGVGIGGEYACTEFSKAKPSGFRASFYIDSAIYGAAAVQEIYDHVTKGVPIPDRRVFPGTFVDATNYAREIHCSA
jgi:L-arabinose transport system substrate-binding protein